MILIVSNPTQAARLAFGLYVFWGLLPIYWAYVPDLRPFEVLFFRMATALPLVFVIHRFYFKRRLREIIDFVFRNWAWISLTAFLIAFNWTMFIYAVVLGRVTEASLGSFLNPIFNVALGAIFFQDRLSKAQWVSVGLATSGVLWMVFDLGQVPWVGLSLGGSFAIYSAVRKSRNWDPWIATAAEFFILSILVSCLVVFGVIPVALPPKAMTMVLLCFAGAITILPLWLFFVAMTQLTLSTLGFLQYVSPTLIFLLGIFLFHEEVTAQELMGYSCVWVALGLYTWDLYRGMRRRRELTSLAVRGR